jgi:hypothetical protein
MYKRLILYCILIILPYNILLHRSIITHLFNNQCDRMNILFYTGKRNFLNCCDMYARVYLNAY